jgi:hypothetical protein
MQRRNRSSAEGYINVRVQIPIRKAEGHQRWLDSKTARCFELGPYRLLVPTTSRATVYRKKLLSAGYLPIPVNGKAPAIQGWSDIQATDALLDRWADQYASATNTGIITAYTPAIDGSRADFFVRR